MTMTEEAWLDVFHGINSWSGFVLLALGAWIIFRSDRQARLALPLYLISVGGALIFMNVAAGLEESPRNKDLARTLFLLGNLFLPLQGLMLLAYTAEQATDHRTVRNVAKVFVVLVSLCAAAGIVAALVATSQTLSVSVLEETGSYSQTRGPLGQWFFMAPQHIGVAVALCLLTWITPFPRLGRQWTGAAFILAGLVVMAGYSASWGLSYNWAFRNDPTEYEGDVVFGLLGAAAVTIGVLVPSLILKQSKASAWPWALLILAMTLAGWFAGSASLPLFALVAPGVIRLLATAFLLAPTVLRSRAGHRIAAIRVIPAVGIVACALAAIALQATADWQALAAGLTLTAFFIIVSLALRSAWSDLRFLPER